MEFYFFPDLDVKNEILNYSIVLGEIRLNKLHII